MIVYDCLDVLRAAVTHFNFISVEYLVNGMVVWFFEWISIKCKKEWLILVVTLVLYDRLNHTTFRRRFLFLFSWLLAFGAW